MGGGNGWRAGRLEMERIEGGKERWKDGRMARQGMGWKDRRR
jgi:hypothetical protein